MLTLLLVIFFLHAALFGSDSPWLSPFWALVLRFAVYLAAVGLAAQICRETR